MRRILVVFAVVFSVLGAVESAVFLEERSEWKYDDAGRDLFGENWMESSFTGEDRWKDVRAHLPAVFTVFLTVFSPFEGFIVCVVKFSVY